MRVSLIAAVAKNGVIGRNNDLPWRIRDDMRFFVQKTKKHAVITGRRNFEAMGQPLGDRENYVVSRGEGPFVGAHAVHSVEAALIQAEEAGETEAFVIGGAEIFRLAWPYAHTFYRTRVLAEVPGDVFFPPYDESEWVVTELLRGDASERNEHAFVIEELTRSEAPRSYWETGPEF
jgi:dihydrofolate reductase